MEVAAESTDRVEPSSSDLSSGREDGWAQWDESTPYVAAVCPEGVKSRHCRRARPWARCPVSPQPPSPSLATLSVLGSPREVLSVPRTSSVRRPGQSCSRVPQCLGRACGCHRGSAKVAKSPRAQHVPPCPTCVRGACALGAAVQQPRPKHGEGLHVQPLVLCEVLARGQHCEEVCGHSPVHLGDRTWLWEARKDRQLCRVRGAVAGGGWHWERPTGSSTLF